LLNDLPWGEPSLVRIGPSQVEVEVVKGSLGQEVGAAGEGFQIEELPFHEGVDGFNIALERVVGRRDAIVLGTEVGDGVRKVGAGAFLHTF
jgi:hypothetical protein